MLTQLSITNFAIIDKLEINFKDGLIVLTGETGAGKSIIIDALDILLGERSSADLIKTGANKAQIEGTFLINNLPIQDWLTKNGFDFQENSTLTISRELTSQGSKTRINGSLANVSHLLYLREFLLDIHEQSGHIELLKIEKQAEILDNFGGKEHKKLIDDYKRVFEELRAIDKKLKYNLEHSAEITKQLDFLKFEINEIKAAKITDADEDSKLDAKREVLLNKKELIENTNLIYELTSGENQSNVLLTLSQIKKTLAKSVEYDKSFESYLEIIENIIHEIKELSSFTKNYCEGIDAGNGHDRSLPEIEERLDLLYRLKKKYGGTLSGILEHLKQSEDKLNMASGTDNDLSLLEQLFEEKEKDVKSLAERLTKSREKLAKDFVNEINEELQTLGFNRADSNQPLLVVQFTECELSPNGQEQIQLLFTANVDEPPKPLLKVASGGELSRIMLAIKSTSVETLHKNTMVFDEIDIGVSGEIASSVAKKLYKISKQNQVICISHQPIICAMSDQHFVIEKKMNNGITQVQVKEVSHDEKTEALASLLTPEIAKSSVSSDAKEFAKSLLENARKIKKLQAI